MYPRHEGHDHGHSHGANIKYGYIVFLLSCSIICLLSVKNHISERIPKKYSRFLNPPLWLTVFLWFFFLFGFCTFQTVHTGLNGFAKRAGR